MGAEIEEERKAVRKRKKRKTRRIEADRKDEGQQDVRGREGEEDSRSRKQQSRAEETKLCTGRQFSSPPSCFVLSSTTLYTLHSALSTLQLSPIVS